MNWKRFSPALFAVLFLTPSVGQAQHSVARQWNDVLLESIRNDFARPTVHARNLFHTSIAMYDAWAAYDDVASTYMLGKTVHGFSVPFFGFPEPADVQAAREEAISYAVYRLIHHRFQNAPGAYDIMALTDELFTTLGYDPGFLSTDYESGSPAALGNYIAQSIIEYGLRDHSNEQGDYANLHYEPINPTLLPVLPGNPDIVDLNRWQPLTLDVFIDQAGNVFPGKTPEFLSPEWGSVPGFALEEEDLTVYNRDGFDYLVYHDPGPPPYIQEDGGGYTDLYRWNHELVAVWSSHHDPTDGILWDISPASIGNIPSLPQSQEDYPDFYDLMDGGDTSLGRTVNPYTGQPYEPQIVPRGDYTRILAEFWADGPSSETPPGHWFTILNYVNDHPVFEKRFKGEGPVLDPLEWDVKAYFLMGGAMHDAAVTSWGIKGWYDYIRPVSAIRAMSDRGQSSEPGGPRFDPIGLTLLPGICEVVQAGDPLAVLDEDNIGKIKLFAWKGPRYIRNPRTDQAGVDWILADHWWPYQRPSFVTPPFAGYISGHSTYSRTAAEIMTFLTGDEYFPGGMGEFSAPMNEFLVFEEGPSMDVTLQWATYRDASDQCSLSRIWGGIHPPADDIPGRIIGESLGADAFALAESYFGGDTGGETRRPPTFTLFPNPVASNGALSVMLSEPASRVSLRLFDVQGRVWKDEMVSVGVSNQTSLKLGVEGLSSGIYYLQVAANGQASTRSVVIFR